MRYYLTPAALADLRKLQHKTQQHIITKLDFYTNSEKPLKFARSLKYREIGEYRFQVGAYRIIFDVRGGIIIILAIGHRRHIYE